MFAGSPPPSAPPVGALPAAKVRRVTTTRGQLVSVALPRRAGCYVWRVARTFGKGHTAIVVAETRGESASAYRAVRYAVTVV